jgi:hypothetical protein
MRTPTARAVVLGAMLVQLFGSTARAQSAPLDPVDEDHACARVRESRLADGPVALGLYDADFGTARSACLRSTVDLYERLGVVYDLPGFYGGVRADTIVSGSVRLRPHIELIGAIEAVHWELVQNGPIKATALGLGQMTLGVQGLALETRRFALSIYGRVIVPTASWPRSAQSTGAELGLTGLFRPRRDVELHAQLAADFIAALVAGPPQVRGGTTILVGLQYVPARWFAFTIDAAVVLGHRAPLDAFLPQLGLRFRVWRDLNLELDATAPLGGGDRRLAIGALRVAYRF